VPDGSVKCDILPRSFTLTMKNTDLAVGGGLPAVVVVDDSLWSVERDGAKAMAVISLRKAVPDLWTRLLVTDAEPEAPPQLLDGLERKKPMGKQELLRQVGARHASWLRANPRDCRMSSLLSIPLLPAIARIPQAKERAKGMLDGPSKAVQHVVEGKTGEKVELTPANLPELPVVTVRNCTDCEIVISSAVAAVKLMMEGCSNTTVILDGKMLTETLEVWGCSTCAVHIASPLKTVQVDACDGLKLQYQHASDFDRCLSAGAFALHITFLDNPPLNGTVDLTELRAQMPDKALSAETDQFITRNVGGNLLTELIIRLSNDFPTTQREVIAARPPRAFGWPMVPPR
jgi:hypothetical protein